MSVVEQRPAGGTPSWVWTALVAAAAVIGALLAVILVLLLRDDDSSDRATDGDEAMESETFDARGDVTLTTNSLLSVSGSCQGQDGYDDMVECAPVVIRAANGDTVAVGRMGLGAKTTRYTCVFPFTVEDVPAGVGPYSVEVSSRGEIPFTEDDAQSISLTLSDY